MILSRHVLQVLGVLAVDITVAQPVLTEQNSFPLLGESFIELAGSPLDVGLPGAWQVWDFSAFQAQDTFMFSCTGPVSDSIGGCPLQTLVERENGDYVIADDPSSVMIAPWFGYPLGTLPTIHERSITLRPPMTFGDTLLSAHLFRLLYNGCDAYYEYRPDTSIADGYGTLTLPSGSYGPALRVRTMSGSLDPGAAPLEAFRYYLPGIHHPVVTIAQGFPALLDTSWTMRMLHPSSMVGVQEAQAVECLPRIWPQPVQDALHIDRLPDLWRDATGVIFDAKGRKLRSWDASDLLQGVDVSFLSDGLYILRIQSPDAFLFSGRFICSAP